METIGLIAAMSQESRALLRCIQGWERTMVGVFHGYRFQLSDRTCLLIQSGIGLKRARQAAQSLLAASRPQFLVSFGVAGAVRDDLQIGDVILADHACLLEKDIPGTFQRLAAVSDAARHAAALVLQPRGARLFSGTAITTRGSQSVRLPQGMPHPVLEMETAGIAQVAAERGIPLVALRAVSDGPRAPLPFNLEAVTGGDFELRIFKMIKMVARHPRIILQSIRLLRNIEKASCNAAIALIAVLNLPSPVLFA